MNFCGSVERKCALHTNPLVDFTAQVEGEIVKIVKIQAHVAGREKGEVAGQVGV